MNLDVILGEFQKQAASIDPIDASLKIVLDGQTIFIDGTGDSNEISTTDGEADCTITSSIATFAAIRSGDMNPMEAVMSGDIVIDGDMMVAMQLQNLM